MSKGGYSGTPLLKKLGCKPGGRLLTRRAPPGWTAAELPSDAISSSLADGQPAGAAGDVVLAFFSSRGELVAELPPLGQSIFPDGALWVAWPRRAAGHDSDIREQDIRDAALPLGLVDVKVAALGEHWSGLRLVWRRERRRA
jgi:Protein of unknown function (DUF3052)